MSKKMTKFDYINIVSISTLKPQDKCLLIELIMRAETGTWECYPSVQRLCMARGMKHEKNFKGADYYLPGIVSKTKRGRRNLYKINTPAIEGLSKMEVNIKHTPPREHTPPPGGLNTPAHEDNAPSEAADLPVDEGANSSMNTSLDSSLDTSSNEVEDLRTKEDERSEDGGDASPFESSCMDAAGHTPAAGEPSAIVKEFDERIARIQARAAESSEEQASAELDDYFDTDGPVKAVW